MTIATKINAWLTPTVRKYVYAVVALVATVAAIWGLSTDTVNLWVALAVALGGLGSSILSAIVTKRPDMAGLYSLAVVVIAALVALRFLQPSLAGQIDNTLAAVVTLFAGISFTRTDTSTATGSPAAEIIPGVIVGPVVDTVTPVAVVPGVPMPSDMAIAAPVTSVPADGTPPTAPLS